MAMRAEAANFEYAPSYRFQTPENGSGATPSEHDRDRAAKTIEETRDAVEKFAAKLSEGVNR